MDIRRELLIGTSLLLSALLLVSFGSVALLTRMTPAIERILLENDYSLEATEEMLLVLALAETSTQADATLDARFGAALGRARKNVTEDAEYSVLTRVEANASGALRGDFSAREKAVVALEELAMINRRAMRDADAEAQRLGRAGAWAVVFVGFFGFAAALLAFSRVRQRVLEPLDELHRTLLAFEEGERARRAFCDRGAPSDISLLVRVTNRLLDQASAQPGSPSEGNAAAIRSALIALIDESKEPVWLTDPDGRLVLANQAGLDALLGPDGPVLRSKFTAEPPEGTPVGDLGHRLHRSK